MENEAYLSSIARQPFQMGISSPTFQTTVGIETGNGEVRRSGVGNVFAQNKGKKASVFRNACILLNYVRVRAITVSLIVTAACTPQAHLSIDKARAFPPHAPSAPAREDFINALKDIDGETCRQAIDLCDGAPDLDDYDITAAACGKFSKGRIQCLIDERRRDGIIRRCKVTLARTTDGPPKWYVVRDKKGDEPRALLAVCRYQ